MWRRHGLHPVIEPWYDEELKQQGWDHWIEGIAARTGSTLQCTTESARILECRRMGIYWPVGRQMHPSPRGTIG